MKIAVLSATKRHGGLDVIFDSLMRQTLKPHVWIVADDLQEPRMKIMIEKGKELAKAGISMEHFEPLCKRPGYYSNLPAIYNRMIERAREWDCDIAVSLQDYIVPPYDGLEKFAEAHEMAPGALVAGLCSMLRYPDASSVESPQGLWSVFREPWSGPPSEWELEWLDVRANGKKPGLNPVPPTQWEMNWAMFPLDVGVWFDESYGEHIGHENVQFAWACNLKAGRDVYVQGDNHAMSLPHRHYFPEEWEEQQDHRKANHDHHQSIYGSIEQLRRGM